MCDCIDKVDKLLAESNTALDIPLTIDFDRNTMRMNRVRIVTKKLDDSKRIKPKSLIASYCPFCGEPYPDSERTKQLVVVQKKQVQENLL